MPQTNLCFLLKGDEILLALKKRKFGVGKWNGVGGKIEKGETMLEALVREIKEEINVEVEESDLKPVALLDFRFENEPSWDQDVHVFFTEKWKGEPVESEEMMPKWYKQSDLPYDVMWEDDQYWLPEVLKGRKVRGFFNFDEHKKIKKDYKIEDWK